MAHIRRQDPLNLTGEWLGLYSYTGATPPVPFQATLKEMVGEIEGVTHETVPLEGAIERKLDAMLLGQRKGRAVNFLKTYQGRVRGYDSVAYAGEVSADGAEIDGRWTIEGKLSGPFLMIRAGHAAVYGASIASARA